MSRHSHAVYQDNSPAKRHLVFIELSGASLQGTGGHSEADDEGSTAPDEKV